MAYVPQSDAEARAMIAQVREALLQFGPALRNAHREGGTKRQCCREGTCEESRGLATWAAHRGTGSGGHGQAPARPARRVRLTRDGAQVVNGAFQRAADDVEAALPPEWRALYRDAQRLNVLVR